MEEIVKKRFDTAPRYRAAREDILTQDFYTDLIDKFPSLKKYSKDKVKNIIQMFGDKVQECIINNREGVDLPEQLGTIFIGKYKRDYSLPDYNSSQKIGKLVNHVNTMTDNYGCKIFYTSLSQKYVVKNIEMMTFRPLQEFGKTVGRTFNDNWMRYVDVDTAIPIQKQMKMNFAIKMQDINREKILKNYNEFEL